MMADDKRRRARIQGSWAGQQALPASRMVRGPAPGPRPASKPGPSCAAASSRSSNRTPQPAPVQSDCVKQPLIYTNPGTVRRAPDPREIQKDGTYIISTQPNGEAKITLTREFLFEDEADYIFATLKDEIPWVEKQNIIQGTTFNVPRLTCWYGEHPYNYSKVRWEANTDWHESLLYVKSRIEQTTGHTFNSCLVNHYRNGHDHVSWHSDDEPSLGSKPTIASVSLGDTRTFEMRKKPPPEEDYTYVERLKIPLTHGSLLLMEGASQDDWQHQIPREYHNRDARINLTFRTIYAM